MIATVAETLTVDEATLSFFFAFLSLVALGLAAIAVATAFTRSPGPFGAGFVEVAPLLAAGVAITATAGSLYYSEIANFTPCTYCWYQRIAMYPLAVILPVGIWRRNGEALYTAVPLAVIGAAISVYHYQLQLFPDRGTSCAIDAPCSARWVEEFGFISIPFMAGSGFVAVIALTLVEGREKRNTS